MAGRKDPFGFLNGRTVYDLDPTKQMHSLKEAWEAARQGAGAALNTDDKKPEPPGVRFHDLRHTCCTRLIASGVTFPELAKIMGWSASQVIRMARVYDHGQINASVMEATASAADDTLTLVAAQRSAQKSAQSVKPATEMIQ